MIVVPIGRRYLEIADVAETPSQPNRRPDKSLVWTGMDLGMEDIEDFVAEELGQDSVEYALVAALAGSGAVASTKTLSTRIGTGITSIGTTLTTNV